MRRSLLLAAPVLALSLASCQDLSTIAIACTNSSQCPMSYFCGSDSLCHLQASCVSPLKACGTSCVTFDTTSNCGGCGVTCDNGTFCDATQASPVCTTFCTAGVLTNCSGTCRDTKNDSSNCGTCGNICPTGKTCVNSTCQVTCPEGESACGAKCVDKNTDLANCGSCGNACPAGDYCVNGSCATQCGDPLSICGDICVNKSIDAANCGSCGKKCPTGQSCSGGSCQLTCETGLLACLVNGVNACVDVQFDQQNCGSCGNVCGAGQACTNGTCTASCPANQTACSDGCATTASDPNHCGSCGVQCGQGERCVGGTCQLSCQAGLTTCDEAIGDAGLAPTCVDTSSDSRNCGICGRTCGGLESCVLGQCTLACPLTLAACGNTCVNTLNDGNNCGACGKVCGNGESCVSGSCAPTCPSGSKLCAVAGVGDAGPQADAGVSFPDGGVFTCVDTATDNLNCNACGHACASGQVCSGGACVATCGVNSLLCGGACVSTLSDPNNCGGCATSGPADAGADVTHVCPAGEACSGGACVSTCGSGLSVCGGLCYDLNNDPRNCGGCNVSCGMGESCSLGVCQPSCQAVCNGVCTNTNIDPVNCGACGSPCGAVQNGVAVCSNRTCASICTSGFAHCAGGTGLDCETNLGNSAQNCGACGNVCAAPDNSTGVCSTSKCSSTCQAGFGNCDGDLGNGCEANESNDALNCGACGTACTGGFCGGTSCQPASSGVPAGVQQNVALADLATAGYTVCKTIAYNDSTGGAIASNGVLQNCPSATRLMLGCRLAGSSTLLIAAGADAASVMTATTQNNTTLANGVRWYFTNTAWGFAPAGAAVDLTSGTATCDVGGASDANAPGFGSQRLCWQTSSNTLGAGARCGDKTTLNGSAQYERVILSAP